MLNLEATECLSLHEQKFQEAPGSNWPSSRTSCESGVAGWRHSASPPCRSQRHSPSGGTFPGTAVTTSGHDTPPHTERSKTFFFCFFKASLRHFPPLLTFLVDQYPVFYCKYNSAQNTIFSPCHPPPSCQTLHPIKPRHMCKQRKVYLSKAPSYLRQVQKDAWTQA